MAVITAVNVKDFPERKNNPKYYMKKWMLLLYKSNMKSLYSIWHGWSSSKFRFVVQIVQCQIWLLNIPFLCFGNKMGVMEMWAGITPLIPPQKHLYPRHTSFSGVTAVLRVLKGKKNKKSINTIVKPKHLKKLPAAGYILSHEMHNRQCTCPLGVPSLSKAGKYKKYWIGRPHKNLELLLCTSSSGQMCTFCNCYQFWAARAEFLFTESICAIKFCACYDLYIYTHNNIKITLHK